MTSDRIETAEELIERYSNPDKLPVEWQKVYDLVDEFGCGEIDDPVGLTRWLCGHGVQACDYGAPTDAQPAPVDAEQWAGQIAAERERQVEKGYDRAHDEQHGIDHVLRWAQEYGRLGKAVEAAALVEAAREMLNAPVDAERVADMIWEAICGNEHVLTTDTLNAAYALIDAGMIASPDTIAEANADGWDEGYEAMQLDINHVGKRMRTTRNPYRAGGEGRG